MRRTLAFTALALAALALASCATYTERVESPPAAALLPGPAIAPPAPASTATSSSSPYATTTWRERASDPLDVRRIILEKKAKLLTLEAQKLALEKSLRDLREEIAAEEKKLEKLPKKKAETKAKPPSVTQQVSVKKMPKADADAALARKLEAVLERLDRLERRLPPPVPPGVPAP